MRARQMVVDQGDKDASAVTDDRACGQTIAAYAERPIATRGRGGQASRGQRIRRAAIVPSDRETLSTLTRGARGVGVSARRLRDALLLRAGVRLFFARPGEDAEHPEIAFVAGVFQERLVALFQREPHGP